MLAHSVGLAQGVRDVPQYTIEDFLGTTAMFGASFSPDESKILVSSDQSGIFNAFAIPVDGSKPIQLTNSSSNAIYIQSYFPTDERFIFESDEEGNELTHVYVRELDGSSTDITPGEKLKANFESWAHDKASFFVSTNERDRRYFDLYEFAVDGYERSLVYENTGGYEFGPISRDKRYLALVKPHTRTNSDVYVYDRQSGELRHVTPHEGDVSNQPQEFSVDGRSLFLVTDEGDEFRYLVRHDLASAERKGVEKPGWDVWSASLSESGRYLVVAVNRDARTEMRVYETANMQRVALPQLPNGNITSVRISRREGKIAFYLNGSRAPSNLFLLDLASHEATQLTQNLNPKVNPEHLVDAQVVRFDSYDGVEVPGLLYRPHAAGPESKAPALVSVHGGPGGQSREGYNALTQYLVNSGYVVYRINNRGSSGYGKTFFSMDDRKHGDADLDDCVASKKFLVDQGYVDPERIGIIGGSYGGYMVLAALTFRPDAFEVGIDIFGISNWMRTLESIPPWWEARRVALYKELGDPGVDRDYLHGISPLFHAGNIRKPLMVLQGANDPRVHQVESDEIVAAARANGVEVEYLVFEDEGHGFRKKENRLRGYRAIRDFCDKHLKGAGVVAR
ncbi:MAG: S9 family peptidase [Candidatus Latescibacterota bacterium]|nr:MAG: S9 family peptidase [Candidatus Latescibacterota bacterium]